MSSEDIHQETFEEFKKSFSYGSRTDLNFKFLAGLSDADAAAFIQELFWKLGDTLNDGDLDRVVEHIVEGQIRAYSRKGRWGYDTGPFSPLKKHLSEVKLGLISSTGQYIEGDDPGLLGVKNMTQQEAIERIGEYIREAPELASVPIETPQDRISARHGGFDVRAVQQDTNTAFPIHRLRELQQEGIIGELAEKVYSFVGACAQKTLQKHTAPLWSQIFLGQGIDAALLVPV
ncbi:MAG: glycine/sarcosine/betaine reductase selenoprotein B family protein [Anaerolineaceae bacterium]|nr:glycine/sarcosine/betaine reductase selenoprotein B family protein [Anaerolineaceae bacterium]